MSDDEEIPLEGGNVTEGVVRIGNTVRRPMGPASPIAQAVLRHLAAVGFDGAPRFLGVDDKGREILTFHEGQLLGERPDVLGTDGAIDRAARLIAAFHRAATGFTPPERATWWTGSADPAGGDRLLHGDLAPWNVLAGEGRWVIIDWDTVSMGRLEWELAYALHTFVPLWPHSGLSDVDTARRLARFAEAYGMEAGLLDAAVRLVPDRCQKVADDIAARGGRGEPAFVRMAADGHATNWSAAARHVASRLSAWRALLFNAD